MAKPPEELIGIAFQQGIHAKVHDRGVHIMNHVAKGDLLIILHKSIDQFIGFSLKTSICEKESALMMQGFGRKAYCYRAIDRVNDQGLPDIAAQRVEP